MVYYTLYLGYGNHQEVWHLFVLYGGEYNTNEDKYISV